MSNQSGKIFWGVVFILLGLLLLAKNLGYVDLHYTIRTYWPVVVILLGIQIVAKSFWRGSTK